MAVFKHTLGPALFWRRGLFIYHIGVQSMNRCSSHFFTAFHMKILKLAAGGCLFPTTFTLQVAYPLVN